MIFDERHLSLKTENIWGSSAFGLMKFDGFDLMELFLEVLDVEIYMNLFKAIEFLLKMGSEQKFSDM